MLASPLTRTNSFGVRRRVTKVNDKLTKMNEKANDIRQNLENKYGVMSQVMEQCLLALAVLALLVVSSYVITSRTRPAVLTPTVKPVGDSTRPIRRKHGTFRVPEISRELREDSTRLLVGSTLKHQKLGTGPRPPVQAPASLFEETEELSPAQALRRSLEIGLAGYPEGMDTRHLQAPAPPRADSSERADDMEPPAPDHASQEDSFEPIQEYTDDYHDLHELTDHLYEEEDEEYEYVFEDAPLSHLEAPPHAARVQSTFHSLLFDEEAAALYEWWHEEREL